MRPPLDRHHAMQLLNTTASGTCVVHMKDRFSPVSRVVVMADTVVMGDTDLKSLRTRQIGQCEPPFAMTADGASVASTVRATAPS